MSPDGGDRNALNAIRTRDPLLRRQVLYPLSYEGIMNLFAGNFKLFLMINGIMTVIYI